MTVDNRKQAWEAANKIFTTDYEKDEAASVNVGYDIYRHPTLNHYSKICDLGNRLEILAGEWGENVVNIWIVTPKQESTTTPRRWSYNCSMNEEKQNELQRMAENIFKYGKTVDSYNRASEFQPPEWWENNGEMTYKVEKFNTVWLVGLDGAKVIRITQIDTY